jgi:hypothetical protein
MIEAVFPFFLLEGRTMRSVFQWLVLPVVAVMAVHCGAVEREKDVSWRAKAEIARRGALVERVDGMQAGDNPQAAIAAAMQPPADDSHKWLFTLVTTRGCPWCEQARRDLESDPKLKAWVDTKDNTKSWAHWQIVQIEDQSQAWRWKDFRPTSFPTLIVQPPVNASWGDPHTIVFAHQGYLKPSDLDAAIRKAIQLFAAKTFSQRRALEGKQSSVAQNATVGGFQQARGGEQGGGWMPPVTPPAPLPPLPQAPNYPNVPAVYPPQSPDVGALLVQLLSSLFGGPAMANFLLLAILAWQIYRSIAKRQGIPLLLDDATAAQLVQLLKSLPQSRQLPAKPSNQNQPGASG